MQENPYAPPASLIDEETAAAFSLPPARPWQVTVAVCLEAVNLAFGVAVCAFLIGREDLISPEAASTAVAATAAVACLMGVEVWFLKKIHTGRNWARVLHLLLGLFFLALFGFVLESPPSVSLIEKASDVTYYVLEPVVLYLLFVSPGRKWFRRARVGDHVSPPVTEE